MSYTTLTYIRLSQPEPATAVQLHVPDSTPEDEVNDVIASQLSSPLQSYEFTSEPGLVVLNHPHPYRVRFKVRSTYWAYVRLLITVLATVTVRKGSE